MLQGLQRTTNDPKLKIPYGSCVSGYELSNKAIAGAKGFARSKVYVLASKAAFKAFDSITMCEALLEGLTMPAYVSSRNYMYERMCNIDKVFAYLLSF